MQLCLEAAKNNIKRFAFIGLVDQDSFGLGALALIIGRNLTFPQVHVHKRKVNFATEVSHEEDNNIHSLLAQRNIYDHKLYNYTHDYLCDKYVHIQ